MKAIDLKKIRKEMEEELNAKRFEHTLSVAYTAASLAMVHDENIDNALLAGMLHDCAKCLSDKKMISICHKHNLTISEVEEQNPASLLHAKVGSFLAQEEYGIDDPDILNAICYHTTGRPNMSKLEKILYIADYIEPYRNHAPNLYEIRRMAYQDLDKTLLKILEDTLSYLSSSEKPIDSMTKETYEFYRKSIV